MQTLTKQKPGTPSQFLQFTDTKLNYVNKYTLFT